MAQASVSDAPGTPSSGGLCHSAGLGTPWDPPRGAGGSVRGEGSLGVPAQAAAPKTRHRIRWKKMDGWMDGWLSRCKLKGKMCKGKSIL